MILYKMNMWVILVLGIVLVACSGVQDQMAKHLNRAGDLYTEGKYEKARIEYKNALQIDPDSVSANFGLAQTLEKLQQYRKAGGHYLKTIELDPTHIKAKIRLARIYLLGDALTEATKMIDSVLNQSPNELDAIAIRGAVHARDGDKDSALKDAEHVLAQDPGNLNAISLITGIYVNKKEYDKAIDVLEKGIVKNARNSETRLLLASILAKTGNDGRAIEILQEVITLDPDKLEHRLILARFYDSKGIALEAERVLRDACKTLPGNEQAIMSLVSYISEKKGAAQGILELQKFIEMQPEIYQLQFQLARLYISDKKVNQAKNVYQKIIEHEELSPDGLEARSQLAMLALSEKDISTAKRFVGEVLKENPQYTSALIVRGSMALSLHDYPTAISDFRMVLRNEPNQPKILRLLGMAHAGNGESQLAKEQYLKAIAVAPRDVNLQLEVAELMANNGNVDDALEHTELATKIAPDNMQALNALYKLQTAKKNYEAALSIAQKMKRVDKDSAEGYYAAGLIYRNSSDLKSSSKEFSDGLAIRPDSVTLLTALVRNMLDEKKEKEALSYLNKQINKKTNNIAAYNLLGELYLSKAEISKGIDMFRKAQELNPKWEIPYRNIALAYLKDNKTEKALEAYRQGQDMTNGSPMLSFGLANLYEKLGKIDEAIDQFKHVLAQSPDSLLATNNLAMLLVTYRDDPESLDQASKLVNTLRTSSNPYYLDTLGWTLHKNGKSNEAVTYLKKAVEKAPNASVIRYHLGMALFNVGDKHGAKSALKKSLDSENKFRGMDEAKETLDKVIGS